MKNFRHALSSLTIVLFAFRATTIFAGQVDPRFDGVWVGVETFHKGDGVAFNAKDPTAKRAVIAIADSGKRVGIVEGADRGQYEVAAESNGTTLFYQVPGWDKSVRAGHGIPPGRRCKLTLSADGNTLIEGGLQVTAGRGAIPADPQNIKGEFHRQKK